MPILERAVGVRREDDGTDWQAYCPREQHSKTVPQIAARDHETRLLAGLCEHPHRGMRGVSKLRHEPPEVDRVGGGEPVLCRQRRVSEGRLHQSLTLVEIAV